MPKITQSEILKNPLLILRNKAVLAVLKKHWLANHENLLQPEKFVDDFFNYLESLLGHKKIYVDEIKKFYNRKVKEHQRKEGKGLAKPKDMFVGIMKKEFEGIETILDFGCGKLAFLKEVAQSKTNIKELIGVDSFSRPVLAEIDPRIRFEKSLEKIKSTSMDLAVVKLVLHHLNSIHEAEDVFRNLAMALKPGGKLVIFEESFPDVEYDISETKKYLANFDLEMSEVTEDFLQLSRQEKIEFLFLNDWLMNLQNNYMPWTGLYGSMEEWKVLIESVGFKEKKSHFLGAIKHRKRKQGMTAMMVFEK
jgi:SAM-dependent methyltransferase